MADNRVLFISLSSGSSGNCYFIGNGGISFIIDAGIGARTIKKRLSDFHIDINTIDFILVTHDHSDHIRYLTSVALRFHKPVFATESLFKALDVHPHVKGDLTGYKKIIEKEIPFLYKGVSITAFDVPHDASESLGYFIDFLGHRITIVTDLGRVTDRVIDFCKISNHVVIESNYDAEMLEKGNYPDYLINRIKGGKGHLSNHETSQALKLIVHKDIKNVFLCHLSDNNNTPELAYEASYKSLSEIGVSVGDDINLYCLPRKEHRCFELKKIADSC